MLVSTVRPYLRGFTLIRNAPANLIVSTGFAVISARIEADRSFLYQHILSDDFISYLKPRMTGSNYPAVRPADVADYPIPLPPPDERRHIGQVLDSIDEAIERTEAAIAATESLRQALLHELLTRGLPRQHSEWRTVPSLGTVPAAWSISTLGALGRWVAGGTPSKARKEYWHGAIPWISPKDMKVPELWDATDHISETAAAAGSTIAEAGAVLVVVRGMILARSFPIALLRTRCAFNQDIRALTCAPGILPEYVVSALEAQRRALIDLATPSTHGTMRVVLDSMLSRPIAIPPPDEQAEIVRAITTVTERAGSDRAVLGALLSTKSALSSGLLSGRIRIGGSAAGGAG